MAKAAADSVTGASSALPPAVAAEPSLPGYAWDRLRAAEAFPKARLIRRLKESPLRDEAGRTLHVMIQRVSKPRSLSQNALYWAWLQIISDVTGATINELHYDFKAELLPRVERTNRITGEVTLEVASTAGMPKLAPMPPSSPTGTNSVVLKTKAPSASAITLSQAWAAVRCGAAGADRETVGSVMHRKAVGSGCRRATQVETLIVYARHGKDRRGPGFPCAARGRSRDGLQGKARSRAWARRCISRASSTSTSATLNASTSMACQLVCRRICCTSSGM